MTVKVENWFVRVDSTMQVWILRGDVHHARAAGFYAVPGAYESSVRVAVTNTVDALARALEGRIW